MDEIEERLDEAGLPPALLGLLPQNRAGLGGGVAGAVRSIRDEGIVDIHGLHYPRAERDRLAHKPIGVATPIPALVMMADDGEDRA